MRNFLRNLLAAIAAVTAATPAPAEQRFVLDAENHVIEINRAGHVTSVLKHPGHRNIWEARRLPDGGIFYVHREGIALFDKDSRLVMEHAAVRNGNDVEAPDGAVLGGGQRFDMLDSVVDRKDAIVSRTPVPDLRSEPIHSRYRMLRRSRRPNAFWVVQYARKTLPEIESGAGKILSKIDLDPHLTQTPPHLAFATLEPGDGSLYATTGLQHLPSGNLQLACGDHHMKTAAEGRHQLAELPPNGTIASKITRTQLIDPIEGFVDPKTGIEELRITNLRADDAAELNSALAVNR